MTLSQRQFPLLAMFSQSGFHLSIPQAQAIDQRPFRSALVRGYVAYSPTKKGFYCTQKGRDAWETFNSTPIERKDPMRPLTAYFDPTTYQLGGKKPAKRARSATQELESVRIAG